MLSNKKEDFDFRHCIRSMKLKAIIHWGSRTASERGTRARALSRKPEAREKVESFLTLTVTRVNLHK